MSDIRLFINNLCLLNGFYMADKNVNFIGTSETGSKSWKKNLGLK